MGDLLDEVCTQLKEIKSIYVIPDYLTKYEHI